MVPRNRGQTTGRLTASAPGAFRVGEQRSEPCTHRLVGDATEGQGEEPVLHCLHGPCPTCRAVKAIDATRQVLRQPGSHHAHVSGSARLIPTQAKACRRHSGGVMGQTAHRVSSWTLERLWYASRRGSTACSMSSSPRTKSGWHPATKTRETDAPTATCRYLAARRPPRGRASTRRAAACSGTVPPLTRSTEQTRIFGGSCPQEILYGLPPHFARRLCGRHVVPSP